MVNIISIYITGDTHAEFNRFSSNLFPEQKALTKNDYVIICGDFGGVWDYKLSLQEKTYVKNSDSFILSGRPGTGKTTVILFKLCSSTSQVYPFIFSIRSTIFCILFWNQICSKNNIIYKFTFVNYKCTFFC